MYKILNTIIVTTLLLLSGAVHASAAWQLTFDVSTPDPNSDTGTATNRLTIGTDQTATDAYDNKFDTVALLRGPIEAYVVHPESPAEQRKLWRDLRSNTLPQEWAIEVNSPGGGSAINVQWGIDAPDHLNFTLIDQDNNQEIGIRSSSVYSYNSTSNTPRRFLLRVSENTAAVPTTAGSSDGNTVKGGGCGYIKDIGGNNNFPGGTGSAVLNIAILFVPLVWLTTRKTLLSCRLLKK